MLNCGFGFGSNQILTNYSIRSEAYLTYEPELVGCPFFLPYF